MNFIEPKALTPKQRRAWDETRTAILYDAPFFSHLLYTLMSGEDGEQAKFSKDVETAACDDKHIVVNPETFLERPLGHRVFIGTHEIAHAMFGHSQQAMQFKSAGEIKYNDGKVLKHNDDCLSRAQDLFINAMLRDSNIGSIPPDALVDPKYTTKMSVLDIYRDIYEEQEDDKGGGEGGEPNPNFDDHLPPGTSENKNPQQAAQDRDDDRWASEVEAAADSAKAQGKLPGAMQDALGALAHIETNWKDHIRSLLDRSVGTGAFDWRTPDRRLIARIEDPIFAPGRRGFKCRLLVVVADSSGSINTPTENEFMSQIAGIIDEMEPERILFTWCDARTHGWQEMSDLNDVEAVAKEGAKGRGSTSFIPPFDEIAAMGEQPEALIYLTDGLGPFPKEPPPYQVIWGNIRPGAAYPFGDVVQVPVQGEE